MKNISRRLFAVLLGLSVNAGSLMAQRGVTPARPPAPAPAPKCQFIPPGKLTLADIINYLEKVDGKVRTFPCMEVAIKNQGVTFDRNPSSEDTLRNWAATDGIIAAIPYPPTPLPPLPPPPKIAGPLSVTCSSPECEVYVQGRHQKTVGGKTEIKDLAPGRVPLVVYKEGFLQYADEIDLIENKAQTASIDLKPIPPDPSLPQLKLKAALWDMIVAAGRIEQIAGKGTLAWTVAEKKQQWDVTRFAKNAGKDLDITFKNAAGECKLKIIGQVAKPLTCPKLKGDPKVDVVSAATLFLNYQVHDVLGVLSKRELIRSQGNMNRVETVGGPDSFTLTLDADGLPSELNHVSQDKDWTIQYLDYKTYDTGRYPTRMRIQEAKSDGDWEFTLSVVEPH